ncbi:hypothetical protein D3C85_1828860 [compost metagenome]
MKLLHCGLVPLQRCLDQLSCLMLALGNLLQLIRIVLLLPKQLLVLCGCLLCLLCKLRNNLLALCKLC